MGQKLSISGTSVIRTQWGESIDLSGRPTPKQKEDPSPASYSSFGNPKYFKTETVGQFCTRVTPQCPSGNMPDSNSRSCPQVVPLDPHRAMLVSGSPESRHTPVFPTLKCDKEVCSQVNLHSGATSIVYTHHAVQDGNMVSAYCSCGPDGSPTFQSIRPADPRQLDQNCSDNLSFQSWL